MRSHNRNRRHTTFTKFEVNLSLSLLRQIIEPRTGKLQHEPIEPRAQRREIQVTGCRALLALLPETIFRVHL